MKKIKSVKGYAYKGFFEKGWQGNDSAIFVYRKKSKGESWMIAVKITPLKN